MGARTRGQRCGATPFLWELSTTSAITSALSKGREYAPGMIAVDGLMRDPVDNMVIGFSFAGVLTMILKLHCSGGQGDGHAHPRRAQAQGRHKPLGRSACRHGASAHSGKQHCAILLLTDGCPTDHPSAPHALHRLTYTIRLLDMTPPERGDVPRYVALCSDGLREMHQHGAKQTVS